MRSTKDLKKGDMVIINYGMESTKHHFGYHPDMDRIAGKTLPIEKICSSSRVRIKSWCLHIFDLRRPDIKTIENKPELFDVNNLI